MPTRRDFLCTGVLGAAASLCGDFTQLFAAAEPPSAGQLIVRSARYIDLESPVSEFKSWITPVDVFFVRNHMSEPFEFDLNSWRLKVSGEVEHPLSLSFAELARFEPGTVTNTLECAGNGRGIRDLSRRGCSRHDERDGGAASIGQRSHDAGHYRNAATRSL